MGREVHAPEAAPALLDRALLEEKEPLRLRPLPRPRLLFLLPRVDFLFLEPFFVSRCTLLRFLALSRLAIACACFAPEPANWLS